jgi:hypothetical protein
MGFTDSNRVLRGRPVYIPSYSSDMIPYVTKYNVPTYVYYNMSEEVVNSEWNDCQRLQ